MKHKALSVLLLLFILSGVSLYAQSGTSELYVKTIYITRLYSNNLGLRVDYQTANLQMHSAYMPTEWFGESGGYGEVIYGNHPSAPYMSVWYKDGKVDHFRLYVKEHFSDPSWGSPHLINLKEEDFKEEVLTLTY